jgi:hypothetical protein
MFNEKQYNCLLIAMLKKKQSNKHGEKGGGENGKIKREKGEKVATRTICHVHSIIMTTGKPLLYGIVSMH